MKKNITLLLSCILLLASANAQTNVSGFISANTTWNLAGSPYVVVGNALLSNGYTLTIDPGVVVKFESNKTIQIDGQLIAIGTSAQRIIFTSNQATPSAGYWGAIHFADLSIDAVFDAGGNYLSGCILKYCDMLYGGSSGTGMIHIVTSSPYFSQCRIMYSSSDGIYGAGASYKLDSSSVKNCNGAGLSFTISSGCPVIIENDSIMNNAMGGINGVSGCSSSITKSYFSGNLDKGAYYGGGSQDLIISENYFVNNYATFAGGTVYVYGTNNALISKNYFLNNYSMGTGLSILDVTGSNDTVECNQFINNHTGQNGRGALNMHAKNSAVRNNLFDGNINTTTYGVAVSYFEGISSTSSTNRFSNNVIRNNSAPAGRCSEFHFYLSGQPFLTIDHNDFINNTATDIIYLEPVFAASTPYPWLEVKFNNLNNPNSQYELYDNFPYGGENIYVDSNYWGNTNTQHIDSVIYDYFDDATKSVVYYSPVLADPVSIDTSCFSSIPVGTNSIKETDIASTLFPNPFTTIATIKFTHPVHSATFRLYNLYGQLVQEKNNINGETIYINAETIGSGVYVYEVTDAQKKICTGKAVVY